MIDHDEFLRQWNSPSDEEKSNGQGNPRVLVSRNRLLATARGSLRLHLQQQLAEAFRRFDSDEIPNDPTKIS